MAKTQEVRSACGFCGASCGILITIKDGKQVEIKGDPQHPLNQDALFPHGRAALEYVDHPDRLKQPLRRAGRRGQGQFQKISWDEALNLAGDALNRIKKDNIIRGSKSNG